MRLLVTGVTGFVGGHLVDFLRAERGEVEVFGLERLHGAASSDLPPGVSSVQADLDDPAAVDRAIEAVQPEILVHLASQSSVRHSWMDPGGTLRTNVLGLVHLLDALRKRSLRPRTLVVGSADEYGAVDAAALPIPETAPLRPRSPYAVSKAAQGLLALRYGEADGVPVIVTRTFPHTGPRRGEGFAEGSFARQIAEIEAGRRPRLLKVGNLEAVRDFTDVRDVVRAYWGLVERGRPGQVYNVCRGVGLRIGDLLQKLLALSGLEVEVTVDSARLRPADLPALVGDSAKLRTATGWAPQISLERTLGDLLDDWRGRVRSPGPGR